MAHVALWASGHPHLQALLPQSNKRHLANPTPRSCPRAPLQRGASHKRLATAGSNSQPAPFRLENYWQCQIVAGGVVHAANLKAIQLKLLEGSLGHEKAVTMYIGQWEFDMIQAALKQLDPTCLPVAGRPMTYDLLRHTVAELGHKVVSVVIESMAGNTFCSTVLLASKACPACEAASSAHRLDARPTDAINLALRTKAPVYFSKELAARHAKAFVDPTRLPSAAALFAETANSISKSVKALLAQHKDPHLAARLQMALAIAKEDYQAAASIRDKLRDDMYADRLSILVVAMESALSDGRIQEAGSLRNEYLKLRGPIQTQQR